jgi:ankyrin repeat protein
MTGRKEEEDVVWMKGQREALVTYTNGWQTPCVKERDWLLYLLAKCDWQNVFEEFTGDDTVLSNLFVCVAQTDYDLLEAFVKTGIDLSMKNHDDWTALFHATLCGSEKSIHLLLDHGADMEGWASGWTPMSIAASRGCDGTVKIFLEYGANCETLSEWGWTPLIYASYCGHKSTVELLLDHGADKDFVARTGKTAANVAYTVEIKELINNHACTLYVLK